MCPAVLLLLLAGFDQHQVLFWFMIQLHTHTSSFCLHTYCFIRCSQAKSRGSGNQTINMFVSDQRLANHLRDSQRRLWFRAAESTCWSRWFERLCWDYFVVVLVYIVMNLFSLVLQNFSGGISFSEKAPTPSKLFFCSQWDAGIQRM